MLLRGVRGYNDVEAVPPLSSGQNPFYQPFEKRNVTDAMCGCAACDFDWIDTEGAHGANGYHNELQYIFETISCKGFSELMDDAGVPIAEGESCMSFVRDLGKATVEHMKVSEEGFRMGERTPWGRAKTTCPAELKVNLTAAAVAVDGDLASPRYMLPFPLAFNRTSATCMGAPQMG